MACHLLLKLLAPKEASTSLRGRSAAVACSGNVVGGLMVLRRLLRGAAPLKALSAWQLVVAIKFFLLLRCEAVPQQRALLGCERNRLCLQAA